MDGSGVRGFQPRAFSCIDFEHPEAPYLPVDRFQQSFVPTRILTEGWAAFSLPKIVIFQLLHTLHRNIVPVLGLGGLGMRGIIFSVPSWFSCKSLSILPAALLLFPEKNSSFLPGPYRALSPRLFPSLRFSGFSFQTCHCYML